MDAFLATMQQVLDYLHTIKITDLIDIAIISYIFYKIILFAKETRAGQVLRGIGLVIFLLWIANVFNLHILAYILSKAVELGFLALVVVFQPEIRHFLHFLPVKSRPEDFCRLHAPLHGTDIESFYLRQLLSRKSFSSFVT